LHWEGAKADANTLHGRLFEPVRAVGWLSEAREGGWECRTGWVPAAAFGLWIAVPDKAEKSSRWLKVGDAIPGMGMTLQKDLRAEFKEGTLVFARGQFDH
jgi:hypothetical protein